MLINLSLVIIYLLTEYSNIIENHSNKYEWLDEEIRLKYIVKVYKYG